MNLYKHFTKKTALIIGTFWLLLSCGCTLNSSENFAKPIEHPSLKILNIYPGNLEKEQMLLALEKATGFELEVSYISQENGEEKLSVEIASGTPYDLLRIYPAQFESLSIRGSLTDMTDYIYQYGSRILTATPAELWESTMLNGRIYGVPQKEMNYVNSTIIARKDILDRLKIPLPETTEEFAIALDKIKSETQMIPLSISRPMVGTICSGFGIADASYQVNNQSLTPMLTSANMSEYLQYMNNLYTKKLIDTDWPFNRSETLINQFSSGKAAMIELQWEYADELTAQLEKKSPNIETVILQPLKDDDGNQLMKINSGINTVTCMPGAARNKVEAIYFMNQLLKEENFRFIVLGEEGIDYNFDETNYSPILPNFEKNRFYSSDFLFGLDTKNYIKYWQDCIVKKDPSAYVYYEAMQKCPAKSLWQDPMENAPILKTRATIQAQCDTLLSRGYTELITGIRPLSAHKDLIREYEQAGGNLLYEEAQKWYQSK